MTEQRIDLGLTAPSRSGGCADGSCGCGSAASGTSSSPADAAAPETTTLSVEGMTCAHCVRAVTEELNALEGVTVIDVDLRVGDASLVRVTASRPVDDSEISAAIDEAGYTLVR
ncbi:MAG: copper chaperone [Microbacterium sp.]|jgi:copper chaperone CopZ|nr:copper chaperone [Microbacterium sp.]